MLDVLRSYVLNILGINRTKYCGSGGPVADYYFAILQ
jgi:hypothetical protein